MSTGKIKVMIHLPYEVVGGAETAYVSLLKYLEKDGWEYHVTCPGGVHGWAESKMGRYAFVHKYAFNPESLSRVIEKIDPHLILGTHGFLLYQALGVIRINPPPVVEVVHGSKVWPEHNSRCSKEYTKALIFVSNSARQVYDGVIKDNIPKYTILNGVDSKLYFPRKPLSETVTNIGYIGRMLECDKKVTKIIEAFAGLKEQRLFLVGATKGHANDLKRYLQKVPYRGRIKVYPYTDRPEVWYDKLDVVTVRSESEGYCNTVAEALACGIPTVCFNFRGILEHLPRNTSLISSSQSEYAKHLYAITTNFKMRKEMRAQGLDFIKKSGDVQKMARVYQDVFKKYASTRMPPRSVRRLAVYNRGGPVVAVVPQNWKGIYFSTVNVSDVQVHWDTDTDKMTKDILAMKPKKILFSGGPPGFDSVALRLHSINPNIPKYYFYHGGVSHYSFYRTMYGQYEYDSMEKALRLLEKKVFIRMAVCSPGLDGYLQAKGYDAKFTGNMIRKEYSGIEVPAPLGGIHLGNWNRPLDHKHTTIAYGAASLIPGAVLHQPRGCPAVPGKGKTTLVEYGDVQHEDILKLYAQMSVNLQLSFIETCNVSVLEMWAVGAPVLIGSSCYFFVKDNKALRDYVFEPDQTNPEAVARRVEKIIKNRSRVVALQNQALTEHNSMIEENWKKFF